MKHDSNMQIGIIGYGVVGKAAANTLSKEYNLVIYDKYNKIDDFDQFSTCNEDSHQ